MLWFPWLPHLIGVKQCELRPDRTVRPLGALFTLLCHHTGRLCAPEAKRRRPQQIAVKSQGLSPVLQPHRISMSGTAKSIHHVRYVRGISCIHTEARQETGAFKMSQCPFSCGFLTKSRWAEVRCGVTFSVLHSNTRCRDSFRRSGSQCWAYCCVSLPVS